MSRLVVFLLIVSFCLPVFKPGGQAMSVSSPLLTLHAILHEHDVEHHHHGQSHLFELGSSEEAERHMAEGLCASPCCSLLPAVVGWSLGNRQTAHVIPHGVSALPDPYPDRLYRPPQA